MRHPPYTLKWLKRIVWPDRNLIQGDRFSTVGTETVRFGASGLENGYAGTRTVTEEAIADPKLLEGERERKYLKGILSFSEPFAQATLSRQRVVSYFSSHQQLVC